MTPPKTLWPTKTGTLKQVRIAKGQAKVQAGTVYGLALAGGIGWLLADEYIAKAHTLLLKTIQQCTRPDKFSGENAKPQQDGEPPRSRRNNHDRAKREQSETEDDFHPALRLLHGLYEHQLIPVMSATFRRLRSTWSFDAQSRHKMRSTCASILERG